MAMAARSTGGQTHLPMNRCGCCGSPELYILLVLQPASDFYAELDRHEPVLCRVLMLLSEGPAGHVFST